MLNKVSKVLYNAVPLTSRAPSWQHYSSAFSITRILISGSDKKDLLYNTHFV